MFFTIKSRRSLHGVLVKTFHCKIIVNLFEVSSFFYVHFWIVTLQKDKALLSTSSVLNGIITAFFK